MLPAYRVDIRTGAIGRRFNIQLQRFLKSKYFPIILQTTDNDSEFKKFKTALVFWPLS